MFAAEPPTALFTGWLSDVLRIVRDNPARLPEVGVERHAFGRVNSLPSRAKRRGVVIAAPHGSFDWHTAELVEEMSYRTGLAAVTTRGFGTEEMKRIASLIVLVIANINNRDIEKQVSEEVSHLCLSFPIPSIDE